MWVAPSVGVAVVVVGGSLLNVLGVPLRGSGPWLMLGALLAVGAAGAFSVRLSRPGAYRVPARRSWSLPGSVL